MTFAHPPDQPCDATCDHPRSGDPTEALARAQHERDCAGLAWTSDEEGHMEAHAEDVQRRFVEPLAALDYEVRPICQVCTDLHELHSGLKRTLTIEQAAEAADREAADKAGASGYPKGLEADPRIGTTSAAADPPCCDCLCGNCGAAYDAAKREAGT